MKYFAFALFTVALIGISVAYPQQVYYQTLPYSPPPTTAPVLQRARRAVLGGQISTNPAGGNDARLELAHGIGDPNHNLIGSAFAAGNTDKGPVATGGALAYNNNGFGASIAKQHIPGVRDTLTKSLSANLFNNDQHSVAANVFKSQNTLPNGFQFEQNGAGLNYNHANGHAASLTHTKIPDFGSQLGLNGKANLWTSQDKNTRLDLTGQASKWTSGPFSGQKDFSGGVGLTHLFG